jgi:magnesium chelatase subunit I
VVEQIAFVAREDKRIDKRSGVSQRLPISTVENVLSNAERRALRNGEETVVPRIADIYAALPAITGKLELEYEGEVKGADAIAREVIRTAIARVYDRYFHGNNNHLKQVVQYFDLGGEVQMLDTAPASEVLENMRNIQGLMEKIESLGVKDDDPVELQAAAAEFILEGLHAHKRIGRTEERKFTAGEKQSAKKEQLFREDEDLFRDRGRRGRGFN